MEPILPGEMEFTRSTFWVLSSPVLIDFVLIIEKPSMDKCWKGDSAEAGGAKSLPYLNLTSHPLLPP